MSIDTTLDTAFWRATPHVFVKAHWGTRYCRCCLDGKAKKIHKVKHQDSDLIGEGHLTGYRVASKQDVIFTVSGWNGDGNGGSCSFGARKTWEEAVEFMNGPYAVSGAGERYDHYQIEERSYYTVVDTNVAVLS